MTRQKPTEEQLDELREAFDYNDRDGDGRIEPDEFAVKIGRAHV